MKLYENILKQFLVANENQVLVIKGKWGVGKSFF